MCVIDKSKYQFFMFLTILCMFILISSSALANEFDVYAKAESFTWKEYDNGTQILKESGPIYGIGFKGLFASRTEVALTVRARIELIGGQVDYDGQTQVGTPIHTNTNYIGSKTEADLGLKFMLSETSSIGPFASLGYQYWERDIKSTTSGIGYIEKWSSIYSRFGALLDLSITRIWKLCAEGGIKLPMYNRNDVDYLNVTLEPGNKPSFFAEIGTKISLLRLLQKSCLCW